MNGGGFIKKKTMATTCVPQFLLVLLLSWNCEGLFDDQEYKEGLNLKHLPDGRVLAQFEHMVEWDIDPVTLTEDNTAVRHYGIFPKALAEIVGFYSVQELHLSLTKGKWRTSQWGYPPVSSPPGTEFWVWFLPNTSSIDHQWKGLINGVSGLMCTSLSSIDSSSTYTPPKSFRPHGALLGNLSSSFLRYAALPRETVCTENLTPWSKLLPCGQKAGIGSLYSALKLYDSEYISLSVHLKPVCQDPECAYVFTELYQSLSVVFKPIRENKKLQWSFTSLFTRSLKSHCSLADDAQVSVDITALQGRDYTLTPPPDRTSSQTAYGQTSTLGLYSIRNWTASSILNVSLSWNDYINQLPISPPPLHVIRYVTGSGLERGGIVTEITNHDSATPLKVILLEMVPWYFRVLLHTMKYECLQLNNEGRYDKCGEEPVISRNFTPAKDRLRPYTTELLLLMPPSSHVTISVQFLRSFLKWNEYPPDASHGFYINSAVLTAAIPSCLNCSFPISSIHRSSTDINYNSARLLRVHTEPLLVLLPTPDFSMPYNVICFVSTVVAIGFGSIFNLTTKSLKPEEPRSKENLLTRMLSFIKKKKQNQEGSNGDNSKKTD